MADLRKPQPEWDRFLGRELAGMFLACLYELQELEDRYARQRTRLVVLGDVHGNLGPGGVRLDGVDLGRNTSLPGHLFVHVLGAQDPRTLRLYRGRGGQLAELVAEGQGNAGTDVVLDPHNDSRLSGVWNLAPNPTEDQSDRLQLYPVPDWQVRLKRVWDGSVDKDVRSQDEFLAALASVAARLRDARLIVAEALSAFAIRLGSRGAEFLGATSSALVTDTPVRDPSGSIVRRRTGFLPVLARAMQEESVAGEQSVSERRIKAAPAVFAPANRGRGRVAAHAPREFCPPARWTFRCVRGHDSGHGGQEEFEATVKLAGEDRQFSFGGVRVKQSFSGPEGIGPFVLERLYTKVGDPNHRVLFSEDRVTTSGERAGNTEAGVLHWLLEERVAGFDVSFFRSSSQAQGDLMAKAEGVSIRTPFQATERNASGLTVNWVLGPQPQNGATGTLDCNFFRVENPAGVPDEFVIETSLVGEGLIQKLVAEQLGGRLHSKPAGQATVSDDYVRAGSLVSLLEEVRP